MPVGDKLRAEVPAAPAGLGAFFYRLGRVVEAIRDHVEALVQRLEAKPYPPDDATLGVSQITFYVNESTNKLHVRVRYSTGALKTGEIALL